ncbi:protein FAM163B [Hylobates moloch]|uniref:protein FAM163B n=1 Tax=Hylobates moloch TaxID=81572 RepID=UPI0013632C9E|nr:protein FAM163B [Hylobates moloch]XP_055126438.1 protein FAM163B [Symphalangus syndactylus]XP_055126439.1 protein FAM163B [Symphalangus syndactylus]XP_058301966.1 protein FAM163B [Hylobates moloch]XP_058301967.1 protein FAM163B [Hylobates moloch]
MTAGTVVITGGILATVILLCIIAVLCYCRLQYYCCKKDESEEDEEEPDFAVHSHLPPLHSNRNLVLTNGPALYPTASTSFSQKSPQARALCRSCSHCEPPTFFLQEPPEEEEDVLNGGERVLYRSVSQEDVELPPGDFGGLQALNPNRLSAMREAFARSRSISTDV